MFSTAGLLTFACISLRLNPLGFSVFLSNPDPTPQDLASVNFLCVLFQCLPGPGGHQTHPALMLVALQPCDKPFSDDLKPYAVNVSC